MPRTILVDPETRTVTTCGNVRLQAIQGRVGQACYFHTMRADVGDSKLREFDVMVWPETDSSKTVEICGKAYRGSVIVASPDLTVLAGQVAQNVAFPQM